MNCGFRALSAVYQRHGLNCITKTFLKYRKTFNVAVRILFLAVLNFSHLKKDKVIERLLIFCVQAEQNMRVQIQKLLTTKFFLLQSTLKFKNFSQGKGTGQRVL